MYLLRVEIEADDNEALGEVQTKKPVWVDGLIDLSLCEAVLTDEDGETYWIHTCTGHAYHVRGVTLPYLAEILRVI